jgi:hypothetical protein
MTSSPSGPATTFGSLTIAPVPRMPTCGWLMIGVSNSAPALPMLVIVNVPPESSSGPILLARVRAATSAIFLASPARLRSSAFLMTGTSRPRGVSTAIARWTAPWYSTCLPSSVIEELTAGNALSASTVAFAKNGR